MVAAEKKELTQRHRGHREEAKADRENPLARPASGACGLFNEENVGIFDEDVAQTAACVLASEVIPRGQGIVERE